MYKEKEINGVNVKETLVHLPNRENLWITSVHRLHDKINDVNLLGNDVGYLVYFPSIS